MAKQQASSVPAPVETQEAHTGLAQLVGEGHAVVRIENESIQQIAITRPRPEPEVILSRAISELEKVPQFAALAFYSIPYKERKDDESGAVKLVEGPSVKAAHTLVRLYNNTSSGNRIVGEDADFVYTQGVMIDLETNTRKLVNRRTAKQAWNKRTQSLYVLSPDRLATAVGADASKAERNAILNLLPPSIVMPYVTRAKEIAAQFKGKPADKVAPAKERWSKAVKLFGEWGVKEEDLSAMLARALPPDVSLDEKIGTLVGVYNSIKEGHATLEETFGPRGTPKTGAAETIVDTLLGAPQKPTPPPNVVEREGFDFSALGHGTREMYDGEIPPPTNPALEALKRDVEVIVKKLVPEYPNVTQAARQKVVDTLARRSFNIASFDDLGGVKADSVETALEALRRDVQGALSSRGGQPI